MKTDQRPVNSGFGPASTAADVIRGIDLSGKIAIVTGGYSGLGRETVRIFRAAGARVIVPARDTARAAEALKDFPDAEIEPMDLLDPASIAAFVTRFLAAGLPLHIVVNSAGIMACPLARDARGYESQFATNHLGHFQLVTGLWPALVRAKGARVVSVSSKGHRFSPVIFEDLHFERRPYDPWLGYGQSKTANILFAVELDVRGKDEGIRAFSVHPGGIVGTGLDKHVPRETLIKAGAMDERGRPIIDPAQGLKNVGQGAATQVWCATSLQLEGRGGVYCEDVDIASPTPENFSPTMALGGAKTMTGVLPYAVDPVSATRLWRISENLAAP